MTVFTVQLSCLWTMNLAKLSKPIRTSWGIKAAMSKSGFDDFPTPAGPLMIHKQFLELHVQLTFVCGKAPVHVFVVYWKFVGASPLTPIHSCGDSDKALV